MICLYHSDIIRSFSLYTREKCNVTRTCLITATVIHAAVIARKHKGYWHLLNDDPDIVKNLAGTRLRRTDWARLDIVVIHLLVTVNPT